MNKGINKNIDKNMNDKKTTYFTKTLAVGLVATALTSCAIQPNNTSNYKPSTNITGYPTKSVIVVGGGLSGLTAAYELEQKGYQVMVFEAQNYLGGRVYTTHFANGQYAEAGGELIDDILIHPQVHKYVNRFGLTLTDVGYDDEDSAYYLDGKLLPFDDLSHVIGQKTADDEARFWEALAELAEQVPDPTNPQLAPNALALDNQSALQWVDSLKLTPQARTLALHHIRGEYGEPSKLSLLFLAQQQKVYEDAEDEQIEIHRIKGGNSELAKAFANHIKGEIFINSPVTRLTQNANGVTATTKQGKSYKADYAVVSTPASVLKNINFSPALPKRIQDASQLRYGQHNKVLLQYKKRFWLDRGLNGDTASELPIGWTWETTDQQAGDTGILVAYTSGDLTSNDAKLDEQALIAKRRQEIETMYPEAKNLFMSAKVFTWQASPWVEGGYTAYAPNQVVPFWTAFHKPYGRIYFAGEHTDNLMPGYIEGAIRSGQRVAKQMPNLATQAK